MVNWTKNVIFRTKNVINLHCTVQFSTRSLHNSVNNKYIFLVLIFPLLQRCVEIVETFCMESNLAADAWVLHRSACTPCKQPSPWIALGRWRLLSYLTVSRATELSRPVTILSSAATGPSFSIASRWVMISSLSFVCLETVISTICLVNASSGISEYVFSSLLLKRWRLIWEID